MVHLWEEPVYRAVGSPRLEISISEGVHVVTPLLPDGYSESQGLEAQRELLDAYLKANCPRRFVAWYYTPMALRFSDHLSPAAVVYDCMDELSAFQGAPPALIDEEQRLFQRADVVFAGGASLYASKSTQHANVHLFPSSIDYAHFATARMKTQDPVDQQPIPHPRIGFYGVLDERLDRQLLEEVAALHPEWHLILIGPLAKISEADLPRAKNLHYLGAKSYTQLPVYLSGWDVAMLPFARNDATRFISPTKTPEYLAGGKPVVSTPIADVVSPYGDLSLVQIGGNAQEFASAIAAALCPPDAAWRTRVDAFLAQNSWDKTFAAMRAEIERCTTPPHLDSAAQQDESKEVAASV